jgi:DNA polymerase/3'-5' exonuclease PolX
MEESKPGYLDLRIAAMVEIGYIGKEVIKHIQEIVDSGTIYQTQHALVLRAASVLAMAGQIKAPQLVECKAEFRAGDMHVSETRH